MPYVKASQLARLRAAESACRGFTTWELESMPPGALAHAAALGRLVANDWRDRGCPPVQVTMHRAMRAFGELAEPGAGPHSVMEFEKGRLCGQEGVLAFTLADTLGDPERYGGMLSLGPGWVGFEGARRLLVTVRRE
jgi:hypothetical protein